MRLLAPLGALYGGIGALRAALYRRGVFHQARLQGTVISIGNLSVGGSGKTPVAMWVARTISDAGLPVAVLSRGYGGRFTGDVLIVGDGEKVLAESEDAGDEPVMMAMSLPRVVVAVGRRRDLVGAAVEARFGRRVHVLDDGFQHLRLARDLDIVCLGPGDLSSLPLPAGRLREWPSALRRATLVLRMGGGEGAPFPGVEVMAISRKTEGFVDRRGEAAPPPRRPYLVSGIARPELFEADARALAADVAGVTRFRDHHAFTERDVARIWESAKRSDADAVVTTAKDAVRLREGTRSPPLLILKVGLSFGNEPLLRERVLAAARRPA